MTYRTTFYEFTSTSIRLPDILDRVKQNIRTKDEEHYLYVTLFDIANLRTFQGGDIHSTYLEMVDNLFDELLNKIHSGTVIGLSVDTYAYYTCYVIFNSNKYPNGRIKNEDITWLDYKWGI